MKSNIKAVLCLDIDGTLTDQNHKIHPNDIRIMHEFPDEIQPIFATGRNLMSAKRILASNQIFENAILPYPGIFMNGGASYLTGEKLLVSHSFPSETQKELINLFKSFHGTNFGFFTTSSEYLINPTHTNHNNPKIHYFYSQDFNEKNIPGNIVKAMVVEHDKKILKEIEQKGSEINAEMTYSLPYVIEFAPLEINKAVGLPPILQELSLENIPIYTAGDGQNDLAMFDFAVKTFAPPYAHPAILEEADHVIQRENEGMLRPILDIITRQV